jgi:hypothetical protein
MYFGICSDTFGSNDSIRYSKQNFVQAKQELQSMLTGKHPLSYERAIFVIENAFHDNILSYDGFQKVITKCVNSILDIKRCSNQEFIPVRDRNVFEMARKSDEQMKSDFYKTLTNWAIYSYITDTTLYVWNDSLFFIHLPYYYSTKDPMGTGDWTNTQVTNLLYTKQGNCFALASLFKILANRLQSDASLSTAPSHIYITHSDINGIDYNVELASRSFPGSGTLETLTYTTGDATRNGIALRTLTDEQAVALCLIYLAKGYEHKYGIKDDFMMECAEVALEYDSLNLNAMLLKAELLEDKLIRRNKTIIQLQHDVVFKNYEQLLGKLYTLGYREMPVDMKNILVNGWIKDTVELYLNNYLVQNKDETRKASLSWGLFDEEHIYKPIEQYGQTLFDCKTKKIKGFAKTESLYNDYNFDPVVFAWQVDPLAHKFPGESPYIAFGDNPVLNIDIAGKFKFNAQTLKLMKDRYPTAYKYLYENAKLNIPGNITELSNSKTIINALIGNTNYANEQYVPTDQNQNHYFCDEKFNLTESKIKEAFAVGGGQEIQITAPNGNSDAGGYNEGDDGTDYSTPIQLNPKLFEALENAKTPEAKMEAAITLTSTLINEFMEDFGSDNTNYGKPIRDNFVGLIFPHKFGGQQAQEQIYGNGNIPALGVPWGAKMAISIRSANGSNPQPDVLPNLPQEDE